MSRHDDPNPTALTTLYIVRHGESFDNAGIAYPRTPEGSPLTDRGREQAHAVARRLANVHADAVIASNLVRARHTAEIIASDRDLDVRVISELREREVGSFAGRTDLHERDEYRELFAAYARGSDEAKMRWKLADEWESLDEALQRFVGGLNRIADDYPHNTAIVVAHGTVMRAFLVYAGYVTLSEFSDGSVDNTGFVVVQTDGSRWRVVDTSGIHPAEPAAAGSRHEE